VDALECRRQAAECTRLSGTGVGPQSEVIMRGMARSWVALANQMDRLAKLSSSLPTSRWRDRPLGRRTSFLKSRAGGCDNSK
jgi:hypothetical protein